MPENKTKICSRCKRSLPLAMFSKNKNNNDGLSYACRDCRHDDYMRKRDTYYMPFFKDYNANRRDIAAEDKKKSKEQKIAQSLVHAFVKKELIIPPKICTYCGKARKLEAHHKDYSKPLEIVWLCKHCHQMEHQRPPEAHPKRRFTEVDYKDTEGLWDMTSIVDRRPNKNKAVNE